MSRDEYKELLDAGIIDEIEFAEKKKKLLGESFNTSIKENDSDREKCDNKDINYWICSNCEKENDVDRKICSFCGAIKDADPYAKVRRDKIKSNPMLADWKCEICKTVNKCYIGRCKCGNSKPNQGI